MNSNTFYNKNKLNDDDKIDNKDLDKEKHLNNQMDLISPIKYKNNSDNKFIEDYNLHFNKSNGLMNKKEKDLMDICDVKAEKDSIYFIEENKIKEESNKLQSLKKEELIKSNLSPTNSKEIEFNNHNLLNGIKDYSLNNFESERKGITHIKMDQISKISKNSSKDLVKMNYIDNNNSSKIKPFLSSNNNFKEEKKEESSNLNSDKFITNSNREININPMDINNIKKSNNNIAKTKNKKNKKKEEESLTDIEILEVDKKKETEDEIFNNIASESKEKKKNLKKKNPTKKTKKETIREVSESEEESRNKKKGKDYENEKDKRESITSNESIKHKKG